MQKAYAIQLLSNEDSYKEYELYHANNEVKHRIMRGSQGCLSYSSLTDYLLPITTSNVIRFRQSKPI